MNTLAQVMTPKPAYLSAGESILRAAQLMDELNVGALPICEGDRLVGMITDRDITVRAVTLNKPADQVQVDEAMSTDVQWCRENDSIDQAREKMEAMQIRRIPIVDDEQHLVGIVSLGDLAVKTAENVDDTLSQISEPAQPDR